MAPLILSELLFDENIRDQIKKYKRHFLRVSCCTRGVGDGADVCFEGFDRKVSVNKYNFLPISDFFLFIVQKEASYSIGSQAIKIK